MKTRSLGSQGLRVSALGLGCMGMSEFYGAADEAESLATLDRALELGVTLFDTSDVYGPHTNEALLGRFMAGRREKVLLATKFGILRDPKDPNVRGVCGRPEYVRAACEASLQRLGIETIDLYYQHRVDPDVPIEDTVGAMAELVKAGKARYLGLSEASAETIRRAHAVHPISALQSEYSLWTRDVETTILPTLRELGIGLVAYSPMGRGFLTHAFTKPEQLSEGDWRRQNPRFQGENFEANLRLVEALDALARVKGATSAQVALAWLLHRGEDIVPIPGTKRRAYLEQNVAAERVILTQEELSRLDELFPPGAAAGTRYPEGAMKLVGR